MEGIKTFSRGLTNASGLRVGQGYGQLNTGLLAGKTFPCFEGYPYKPTCGLAHGQRRWASPQAVVPAGCGLPKKRLTGVDSKNRVINTRFDIG